jgi:predicted transcriptional regulator
MEPETEDKFLRALFKKAVSHPREPYMGFRELCRRAETSTKTFHDYLPSFKDRGYVGVKLVGKYHKYYITTEGKKYLSLLEQRSRHENVFKGFLSRNRDYTLIDFADGHATINYEPGTLLSEDEDKIKEKYKDFLSWLKKEYPQKRFYILSSPSDAR